MSNRYQNEPPGPWEIDENGRRFRRVGHGCIEYPMQITTSYGTFDADNMPAPPKEIEPPRPKSWGKCPFVSNGDSQTRMALNVLCSEIGNGKNKTMRAFDDLCQMSKYCSGRAGGRYSDNHAINMAEKWEQLSGAAVEGF